MNFFRVKTEKDRTNNLFVHNKVCCGAKIELSNRFNKYLNKLIFPSIHFKSISKTTNLVTFAKK